MAAAVDGLFVLTVLALAVPVVRQLPPRGRVILVLWLLGLGGLAAAGAFLRDDRVPPYFGAVGLLPSAAGVAFVGLTALPLAWLCFRRRAGPLVAVVWNVAGIAILANIVIHALLSAPTPFQALRTDPPTTIIATLPYIWLPGFLVPLALSLHVASLRTLGVRPAPAKETR